MHKALVLAHRGLAGAHPENSLPAIQAARLMGCDGAEFDVRMTGDGVAVLHHDATAGPGRAAPALSTLSFHEAQRLVPSLARLDDVLQWRRGEASLLLDLEIKERAAFEPSLASIKDATNSCVLTSFDPETVREAKRKRPTLRVGWISDTKRPDLARLAHEAGADILVLHRSNARARAIEDARGRGLEVWVWGVNWAFQARRLGKRGVQGFITDAPRRLLRTLRG